MTTAAAPPLVSVIVRSMARPTLEAALASIAAQDHPSIEIVVVAACGLGHGALPERVGDCRLRLVSSGRPLARSAAANAGLDAAAGDWITFLDDDDRMLDGHVSGLVRAAQASRASVVHSYARAVFKNGEVMNVGQPFSLIELYERNFIQLSAALVDRTLLVAGCRFDESLDILEDWDFFIQLAQHAPFHFEPVATFEWHADTGTSGAGGGANTDDARFARHRDLIYAKWQRPRDALIDAVQSALVSAGEAAAAGRLDQAAERCRAALAQSPNDPHLLGFLAMLAMRRGRPAEALPLQQAAVDVRPRDAELHFNLALVRIALGEIEPARAALADALVHDPHNARARARLAALDAARAA